MRTMVSCATLAFLLGVAGGQTLYAASRCSNSDFKGVYGMNATGAIVVAPGFPAQLLGPFARVGRVHAETGGPFGSGHLVIANTASYNGNIITESYGGTYIVNSDCTVVINTVAPLPIGPGGADVPVPFEFRGVISDNGNELLLINCGIGAPCFAGPTGNVIRISLIRKDSNLGRCTNGDLSGAFQLDLSGWTVSGPTVLTSPPLPAPIPVPQPFARVGKLAFDGREGFTGDTIVNYSGLFIQPETLTGKYSVDSACNVSITFTAGGPHTWTGTLTNRGDGAALIVNDPGVVIAGTLKKQ